MVDYGLLDQYSTLENHNENDVIGRILSQEKRMYQVISEFGEHLAVVSGKSRYNTSSALNFPAVGDFVTIDSNHLQGNAVIHDILPRKSLIVCKAVGTALAEQPIAANVDTIFVCMSLNNDFILRRLEHYLSVVWDSGASPVIVLVKSDLCADIEQAMYVVSSVAFGTDIVITFQLFRKHRRIPDRKKQNSKRLQKLTETLIRDRRINNGKKRFHYPSGKTDGFQRM